VHNANCNLPNAKSPSGYRIGASDGGPGKWAEINRKDTKANRYEKQVTGAPNNIAYDVNGVMFDRIDAEQRVLLDAKRYTEICPLADCKPEFLKDKVANELVEQAEHQIKAVQQSAQPEIPIEWHVADAEMAKKIDEILKRSDNETLASNPGIIKVIPTPDIVN